MATVNSTDSSVARLKENLDAIHTEQTSISCQLRLVTFTLSNAPGVDKSDVLIAVLCVLTETYERLEASLLAVDRAAVDAFHLAPVRS